MSKTKIDNHPLEGRKLVSINGKVNADGFSEYGIESVHEMDVDGQKYICLLTWTPGSVGPQYRSHGQMDWESISLDSTTRIGEFLLNIIHKNQSEYKIV